MAVQLAVTFPLRADALRAVTGELARAAVASRAGLLVTAVTAVSLPVTPPLQVDAVRREPALELQVGAVEVAEHLVSSVLAVCHPVTPLGGVNTPPVMASSLLLRADSEVLGLAVLLVRAVLTVLVVITPPPARDTFPSPAPGQSKHMRDNVEGFFILT